jgi:hypothetical protein
METTAPTHIAIRLATPSDRSSLVRIAALDSVPVPIGAVLVADLGGEIVAAHDVAGGLSIADPFRATSDARELLELRARQLPHTSHRPRRRLPRFPSRRRAVRSALAAPAGR